MLLIAIVVICYLIRLLTMVSYEGNLCTHRLNGEWSLDNIYYHHLVTKERLDIVANQLLFDKDDVIVATYPKSGKRYEGNYNVIMATNLS